MIGIAVTDAHANIVLWGEKGWNIKFPSYKSLFKTVKMHLLIKEDLHKLPISEAKKLCYHSLQQGNCYFSVDLLLDADGFIFHTLRKGKKEFMTIQLGKLIPRVPKEIQLLRNGVPFAKTNSEGLEVEINEPGTYRAEVYLTIKNIFGMKRKVLWIGSNPIVVRRVRG